MSVWKRNNKWYAVYTINGKRKFKSFGLNKKLAQHYVNDIELKKERGELGFVEDDTPVDQFLSRYVEYFETNKSSHTCEVDIGRINSFQKFLEEKGIKKLKEISLALMEQYKVFLLKSCKPKTVNNYIILAKAMLNKAVEWRCLKENPIKTLKELKNPGMREPRYFSRVEIDKILDIANPYMKNVILILINTGMRRSELVYLTWEDIDFTNKLVIVQSKPEAGFHPKSYKPRYIPMNPELEKVLMDLPQAGRYVFDNGKGEILHAPNYYTVEFCRILKKAGIKGANLHALRHTFASYLVMAGVDLRTVQKLLGHSTVAMTEKYSHLSPDHMAKAVEVLRFVAEKRQNKPN